MAPRSLVTGGAGFIGSHVAKHCLLLGHEVTVMDDLSGGFVDNIPQGAEFVKASVTDHELIDRLFTQHHFNYVYHLAAYAAEGLSHFIRRFNYDTNLIGSINVINASVNSGSVERFVFASSIAVYGSGQTPMREDMIPMPEDPYGVSKYAVEMDLKSAHDMFGLEYTIFRPHNVYGENQNIGDHYRNVIGIFISQIMRGEPMTIFGDGLQTRAFSYIDDVAPYIARCVELPGAANEIFNIGADEPITVLDLAYIVAEAFGVPPAINLLAARQEVVHAFSSHEKARHIFGSDGKVTSSRDGVARMVAWAKTKGLRHSEPFADVEILKNMPPSLKADLIEWQTKNL